MRGVVAAAIAAAGLLAATGCTPPIWREGPGATPPTLLATAVNYPNTLQVGLQPAIPYDPSRLEILEWVQSESASDGFSFRASAGGARDAVGLRKSNYEAVYGRLLLENDLDGLLNHTVDTQRFVVDFVVFRFSRWETIVGGVGYRLRGQPRRTVGPHLILREPSEETGSDQTSPGFPQL